MRIFKNKVFNKYCKKQNITDAELCKAVEEIESGLFDANLGGNLYKKRLPKKGEGKSGGHRSILTYVEGIKTFFMFGFEKSDKDNINKKEEKYFKDVAKDFIGLNNIQIDIAVEKKVLFEVICDEKNV